MATVAFLSITASGCRFLVEGTESFVSKDFLRGNWDISSIRMVDGLTLYAGLNGFAGQPDTDWTLLGNATFTDDRADIRYSVIVTGPVDPPDTTAYAFIGLFDVDRNTIWITRDATGEVISIPIRKEFGGLRGQTTLDGFVLFDGDNNDVHWVR